MQHCSECEGASLAAQLIAEKCSLATHQMVQDKTAQTNDHLPVNIYSHLTFERRVQHFLLLEGEAAERHSEPQSPGYLCTQGQPRAPTRRPQPWQLLWSWKEAGASPRASHTAADPSRGLSSRPEQMASFGSAPAAVSAVIIRWNCTANVLYNLTRPREKD